MKKQVFIIVIIALLLAGCKSTPKLQVFSDVKGKQWNLTKIRVSGKNIEFNRSALAKDGFKDLFTMNIDDQTISGAGAPNRYSAPYSLGEGQKISVQLVKTTLMAPIREPEKLREHDFFTYIQYIYEWNFVDMHLELKSKTTGGDDVVLVLALN
jgi:heat shock protein HslJ